MRFDETIEGFHARWVVVVLRQCARAYGLDKNQDHIFQLDCCVYWVYH